MKRTVRPNGIGLHSALLWSERQRLSVALIASIVTHGFALALTPILQPEPQTLPETLQVKLVALAAIDPAPPPDGARGPAPAAPAPDAAPPEPAPPPPPEPVIEVEHPKPGPTRVEKKPRPKLPLKPPERVELATPSPPPEPSSAQAAVAQREPIAETFPVPSPQVEQPVPGRPVDTARAEPQLALAMPSREAAMDEYRQALSKLVVRDRHYPPVARARGWEGTVKVQIRIGPGQKVHEITIERSSGFKVLDAEALEMVRKAQPFPPVPKALGEVVVTVPISFELRN